VYNIVEKFILPKPLVSEETLCLTSVSFWTILQFKQAKLLLFKNVLVRVDYLLETSDQ